MNLNGLIFDLDGVVVDTAKYHYIAWKKVAEKLGIDFTEKDNERLKGVSRDRSFEIVLEVGNMSLSKEMQVKYCQEKNDIYLSYINKITSEEILPGVYDFLVKAKDKGYKTALGSASKNSRLILERLQLVDMFDAIIDGTVVTKAKPDPEVFIKGAEALGLPCSECIVFEDASAGIMAAHSAGMKAIGIGLRELLPEADYHMEGFQNVVLEELESRLG